MHKQYTMNMQDIFKTNDIKPTVKVQKEVQHKARINKSKLTPKTGSEEMSRHGASCSAI
jgi:hypothetical protein